MIEIIVVAAALAVLLSVRPQDSPRTRPLRGRQLHLAEAPDVSWQTVDDRGYLVVKDDSCVRMVSLDAVREGRT